MRKVKLLVAIIFGLLAIISLIPSVKNKKIVLSENFIASEAQKVTSDCQKKLISQDCYIKDFLNLAKRYDADFAKKVLSSIQSIDQSTNNCHTIAHSMARAVVEKDPSSWKKLIDKEDPNFCSGGFFHGIIEAHAGFDNNFALTGSQAQSLCSGGNNPLKEGSCKHILGHIIFVENRGDTEKAIQVCDDIKPPYEDECYGGIFMENVVRQNLKDHGLGIQYNWDIKYVNQTEELCVNQQNKAAKGCWGEMGHLYAAINNDDPQKTFGDCSRAPKVEYRDNCYKLALFKIAITADSQSKINTACQVYNEGNLYNQCVSYMINSFMQTSPSIKPRAESFCNSLLSSYQDDCLRRIGKINS